MPISENVMKMVNASNTSPEMKALMMRILNHEDQGGKQYKKEYIQYIDEYIENGNGDNNNVNNSN